MGKKSKKKTEDQEQEIQEPVKEVRVKSSFMDFLRERTEKRKQQQIVNK